MLVRLIRFYFYPVYIVLVKKMKNTELEVAMQAWQQAEEGVNENFKGYRVVKLPNLVLLMPLAERWPAGEGTAP